MRRIASGVRALPVQEITTRTDSRDILANARRDTERYGLDDYFIVDMDSHHVEGDSWPQILPYIPNAVIRQLGLETLKNWPDTSSNALMNIMPGMNRQDVGGRILHQAGLAEPVPEGDFHRDVTLVRRAMEAMSIDVQVVFPQPMLQIGLHPDPEIATQLHFAYNRWFTEQILPGHPGIKTMLGLPFHDPQASLQTIREFGDHPDVIGFMVTSQRHTGVHRPQYFPVYAELEERGLPLGFHAAFSVNDTQTAQMNKFLTVHALSFVTCNMTHLMNWVINAIPERFPNLRTVWIESGLAWIPFVMQRLDHEYLMRQSDAPLLTKLPSEYMREMYYTSQPMEITNMELLEATFNAMDAPNSLLYSSDWPHWDFDVPGRMMTIPFLSDQSRRNILGENARKVFAL